MSVDKRIALAVRLLEQAKGDDYYRARAAFRGMTEAQMQEQHGASGRTRDAILRGYKERHDEIQDAMEYIWALGAAAADKS